MTIMDRHNVPGQINVYTLDVDSEITHHGRHNRLIVFREITGRTITIREDLRGLPLSTDADRRRIARHPSHRLHPRGARLTFVGSEAYRGRLGDCIEHTYTF